MNNNKAKTMTSVLITAPGSGVFTIGGTGPFDPPAGTKSLVVECWGAGGSPFVSTTQEAGGSSGAYSKLNALAVADGTQVHYQIGTGQSQGGGKPLVTSVWVASQSSPDCVAAAGSSGGGEGVASDCVGDVKFSGARGISAQGGGGSRGGSGGSSSGGPNGPGVQGSAGSHAVGGSGALGAGADVGGGGNGAAGGVAGLIGGDGSQPGGGAGGGGSGTNSKGGRGGDGQIRVTW